MVTTCYYPFLDFGTKQGFANVLKHYSIKAVVAVVFRLVSKVEDETASMSNRTAFGGTQGRGQQTPSTFRS